MISRNTDLINPCGLVRAFFAKRRCYRGPQYKPDDYSGRYAKEQVTKQYRVMRIVCNVAEPHLQYLKRREAPSENSDLNTELHFPCLAA
jgi:hypothetical protein